MRRFALTSVIAAVTLATAAAQSQPTPARFVPLLNPCRVIDSRAPGNPLGGSLGTTTYIVPINAQTYNPCSIPETALAYALNVTAVPVSGSSGWVTVWPVLGQSTPETSTVVFSQGVPNSNSALVGADTRTEDGYYLGGAVYVFASAPTHIVIDITGYFVL